MRNILKSEQQLIEMIQLAAYGHGKQFDKAGKPYILHPLTVMFRLKSDDMELCCIAVGHDLIEDNKEITYELLRDRGFSDRVINGIRCMTRLPGETDQEYLDKVKSNLDSILVKIEDLTHNSDLKRLKGIGEKDFARMKKYHWMYLELKAELTQHIK